MKRRLKQPEYTGENRCTVCTALNALVTLVVATAVATVSLPVAVGLAAACGLVIYLRGYLIPGTPALTAAVVPVSIRRRLGHDDARPVPDGGELTDAETRFLEHGVLAADDDGELRLTDEFDDAWRDRIVHARETEGGDVEALAELLGSDPERTEIDVIEPVCFGIVNDRQIGQWPSRAALVADATAAPELASRLPDWDDLEFLEQGVLLNSLRVFLETCPDCDGAVRLEGSERVDCCGNTEERFAMECADCGTPLL